MYEAFHRHIGIKMDCEDATGPAATGRCFPLSSSSHRFSIDRSTDQESIFHIDPVSGAITLREILDSETAGWHNISVTAVEADAAHANNLSQIPLSFLCIGPQIQSTDTYDGSPTERITVAGGRGGGGSAHLFSVMRQIER
ncbi:hypothetical protein NHX12_030506 [Muraenolepis orangiensis]|uniref:Cadherin domain-containing protein n=1 Tax=Muraenolepis orangiensis TaxID=630683 RepID=A0A9Q0ILV3_9TELE|nr:hypothetical protein NHX12_030506 [Muraenolepis orangiensis]